MKKFKYLIIMLFIFAAGLFTGCDEMVQQDPNQLSTPKDISIVAYGDDKVVFFDAVLKASKYQIRIYDFNTDELVNSFFVTPEERLQGVYLTGLEVGEYNLTVKAFPSDDSTLLNSLESEKVKFIITANNNKNDNEYTITFDSDGGSVVESFKVTAGATINEPLEPTKSGYKFLYWSLNNEQYDFNLPVTGNITLKAVWEVKTTDNPGGGNTDDPKLPTNLMDYYKDAEGLTGSALKAKLRQITSANYTSIAYSAGLAQVLPYTDQDPANPDNIILLYGHVSVKNVVNTNWNREHVWPQSKASGWFGKTGAGCDVHHIHPENPSVNSTRGNLLMGEVLGGTAVTYPNGVIAGYRGNGKFEPNDVSKGDVARVYLYMAIRYSQVDSSYPLTNTIESIETLLRWHEEDPVDDFERVRNNRAQEKQGNRNPFVDYPEFARLIFG